MNVRPTGVFVDISLFILTVFVTMIIARGLSMIIPTEFYFTFQSLFTDRPAQNQVVALISKMAAPLACGFILGWLVATRLLHRATAMRNYLAFKRRFRQQWAPTVFLGGFFAAFLSAWPIIVYWDLLANPSVASLKYIFFALYSLYMFGFGYVALLGFLGAIFVRERLLWSDSAKLVSLPELSRVGALWLLNSGIASAALQAITK